MGGVAGKTAGVLERLVETDDHLVERPGKRLDLVAAVDHRQPLIEMMETDRLGGADDLPHRPQRLPDQKIAAPAHHQEHHRQADPQQARKRPHHLPPLLERFPHLQ